MAHGHNLPLAILNIPHTTRCMVVVVVVVVGCIPIIRTYNKKTA